MVRISITPYAQGQLGDVNYVELPALDSSIETGKACAVIESTKAAFEILAPISGKVTKINNNLEDNPQLVNKDPYGEGWFFMVEMKDTQKLKIFYHTRSTKDCDRRYESGTQEKEMQNWMILL